MLKNYLTIALRNLRKHPGYTFINVVGLAVGMACCLTILLFVQDELSYDRFHDNTDRIYRVTRKTVEGAQVTNEQANTPAAVGPTLRETFGAVEKAVRFMFPYPSSVLITNGDERVYEDGFLWADGSVFDVFDYPLVRGNPETALTEPYALVITESVARRYFGDADPIGRTLTIQGWTTDDYTITGVLEDLPANTHLRFGLLGSMAGAEQTYTGLFQGKAAWTNSIMYTYVLLAEGNTDEHIASRLPAFTDQYLGDFAHARGIALQFGLQPLTDIHLNPTINTVIETNGDIRYVYLFSTIAVLILLIACVNFMNLATARSADRAREVGLRKVLGAQRRQLIVQFLGESVMMSGLAFLLALALAELFLPVLNTLSGKSLSLNLLANGGVLLGWSLLALAVGLTAGSYPAVFLSAWRPARVLKGQIRTGVRGVGLRKSLVVFQFAVTILLLIGTAVIYQQLAYLRNTNLGFDKEQVVVVPIRDPSMRERYETVKAAWTQHPNVASATAASGIPGRLMLTDTWPVAKEGGSDEPLGMLTVMADYDFVETMGIDLVAGRALLEEFPSDVDEGFLINETAVRAFGWASPEEALGQRLHWQQGAGKTGTVIGVMKDFHFRDLHQTIEPTLLHVFPSRFSSFAVRVRPTDMAATLAFLQTEWQRLAPTQPFDYFFLDRVFDSLYRADQKLGQTIGVFTLLAVLIACLGLFGLAAFTTQQRTKEIGIRKVLGASVQGLVMLLSKDFLVLVAVGFALAAPVAYVAMNRWLENFVYHVEISWWIFLIAGSLALAVALLTVSYQAVKAALADPVKSLRYE